MDYDIHTYVHKIKKISRINLLFEIYFFFQYNVSMIGRYVSILPAIKISHIVPVEVARNMRNPLEKQPLSKWNALTSALDDDLDSEDNLRDNEPLIENQPLHFRPKSVSFIFIVIYSIK